MASIVPPARAPWAPTNSTFFSLPMQIVKACLLSTSQDPLIQEIFALKQQRVSAFTQRWSGPKALSLVAPVVEHNLRFAGQSDRAGLGSKRGMYSANPSIKEFTGENWGSSRPVTRRQASQSCLLLGPTGCLDSLGQCSPFRPLLAESHLRPWSEGYRLCSQRTNKLCQNTCHA